MKSISFTISASILAADFRELEQQILLAEKGGADWIHVDVMDGVFVPNISMGPWVVEVCREITALPIDVHLMITQPERYVDAFLQAGANNISVHIESNPNINRTIQSIHSAGSKAGVVINPSTSVSSLEDVIIDADLILVMSVNPGYGGQKFIPSSIEKIKRISGLIVKNKMETIIQVDGGISEDTLPMVYKAGARNFVAGVSIFKYPEGILAGIKALRASMNK
jgi:ribulose-phosphate 3-epimerase